MPPNLPATADLQLADYLRCFAAQHLHSHHRLERAEIDFCISTHPIEVRDLVRGIQFGIESTVVANTISPGRNSGTKTRDATRASPSWLATRRTVPDSSIPARRLGPDHNMIEHAQLSPPAKIVLPLGVHPREDIHAPHSQHSDFQMETEITIGQRHIPAIEAVEHHLKQTQLALKIPAELARCRFLHRSHQEREQHADPRQRKAIARVLAARLRIGDQPFQHDKTTI